MQHWYESPELNIGFKDGVNANSQDINIYKFITTLSANECVYVDCNYMTLVLPKTYVVG